MKLVTVLTLGVALLVPTASSLAADDTMKVEKPIRVLAGIFSSTNGTNKQRTAIGVGYDLNKTSATNPTVYGIYLDYNSKKSNGLTTSLTGIGVSGRFYLESANAAGKPYATVGIGSYSLKASSATTNGSSSRATATTTSTASKLGGKLGIGYELNNGWLGEVDYTTTQKIGGQDAGGTNIRIGYRF
jgi:hypothetical protein